MAKFDYGTALRLLRARAYLLGTGSVTTEPAMIMASVVNDFDYVRVKALPGLRTTVSLPGVTVVLEGCDQGSWMTPMQDRDRFPYRRDIRNPLCFAEAFVRLDEACVRAFGAHDATIEWTLAMADVMANEPSGSSEWSRFLDGDHDFGRVGGAWRASSHTVAFAEFLRARNSWQPAAEGFLKSLHQTPGYLVVTPLLGIWSRCFRLSEKMIDESLGYAQVHWEADGLYWKRMTNKLGVLAALHDMRPNGPILDVDMRKHEDMDAVWREQGDKADMSSFSMSPEEGIYALLDGMGWALGLLKVANGEADIYLDPHRANLALKTVSALAFLPDPGLRETLAARVPVSVPKRRRKLARAG